MPESTVEARHVEQVFLDGAGYADDLRILRGGRQADRASGSSSRRSAPL